MAAVRPGPPHRKIKTYCWKARIDAWRGLTIDLRFNTGGDGELGLQVAGRLTVTPYTAHTKQARNDPNDPTRYGRLRRGR